MTLTERAAAAAELKTTGQCNCTQSVVKVFEDKLPVEGDTLRMLAAGYAAGMGCLESTCGALIGAVMVAGILTEGRGTPAVARALVRSFEQRCGATICKELKGVATGVPLCPCPECAVSYTHLAAATASDALQQATIHAPDVMLLDLGLPDLDGIEVIRRIRSWSAMPIIVISARSEDSDKIEALDSGADDYLTKPFSVEEMCIRDRNWLMSHKV